MDLGRGGPGGGGGRSTYVRIVFSASSLALMCRYTIAFLLFFVTVAAVNQPPPHSFASRINEGSKTVTKDGELVKVSISKEYLYI